MIFEKFNTIILLALPMWIRILFVIFIILFILFGFSKIGNDNFFKDNDIFAVFFLCYILGSIVLWFLRNFMFFQVVYAIALVILFFKNLTEVSSFSSLVICQLTFIGISYVCYSLTNIVTFIVINLVKGVFFFLLFGFLFFVVVILPHDDW